VPSSSRAGGWPGLIGATGPEARAWLRDYLRQVVEVDVPGLGPRRDPRGVRRLIESLARSVAAGEAGGAGQGRRRRPRAAGFHFEALAGRDLRVRAQPLGGTVDSWRDANGREVDAVDTTRHGAPAALAVITSTGYAGRRPDGVHVIPVTTLGP
jgi:hypothetical protein